MSRNRRIAGALTIVFAVTWTLLLAMGLARSDQSPMNNSVHVATLPTFPSASSSPKTASHKVIGQLTVASADIQALPITRGLDDSTLNTGMAGAYPWSGPGQSGVFALAAHRVGAGGPFRHLDQVHVGDRITVSTTKQAFEYRVTSNLTVDASNTSVLNGPKDESRIVLITCTPLDTFAQRIVVTGMLIPTGVNK